ncbi:MAG TPA: hypothetical protein VE029_12570 [Rhizobacter sp.]|nr:hypothetical protein [Rhizobacter sp.]
MASDSDWVQDVRRWYFGGTPPSGDPDSVACKTGVEPGIDGVIGYEAADPSLQARHWPTAALTDTPAKS